MRTYFVYFVARDLTVMAIDRGTWVELDHGFDSISKQGWETAGQAIRRIYPHAEIFPRS